MDIEKYTFNNFTYLKNYDSGETTIQHDKTKPENIFKFYSLSKFSTDALVKGYFYASHPIELNDSFDSSKFLMYASQKLDYEFYERLLKEDLTKEEIVDLYNKDISNEHLCTWYISNHFDIATNLFGIISTTAKENNILMWPHYTQETGFQIKFKTQKLEDSLKEKLTAEEEYLGLFPINYCGKLSPIDISAYRAMYVPIYYVTNVKTDKWSYEDEWRFLVGKQNMGVPYSKSGLDQREDYFVRKENRYVFYDRTLVEEITVANNFFNGRNFEIKWLDAINVSIKPKKVKNNWEYESQILFLDYVVEHLSDKFYHSGTKYELDKDEAIILIRTKEKMNIKKEDDGSFLLTRTNEYIKFMD